MSVKNTGKCVVLGISALIIGATAVRKAASEFEYQVRQIVRKSIDRNCAPHGKIDRLVRNRIEAECSSGGAIAKFLSDQVYEDFVSSGEYAGYFQGREG